MRRLSDVERFSRVSGHGCGQMRDDMATTYRSSPEIQAVQDEMYGEGVTVFLAKVMEVYYRNG